MGPIEGFLVTYVTFLAAVFIPRCLLLKDHVFIFAAPIRVWMLRLTAVFNPKESFSLKVRLFLLWRWLMLLFNQGFWHLLWTLDDLLFPDYRDIDLKGSVFIVGGFRTGSTSLHRTMALDEHRFVSPRMLEIVYPFLLIHYLLDWFEAIDKKYGTKFIEGVDNFFKTVCGEEILARHPMSYYEAEEDDLLFATNYGIGWYSAIQFPSVDVWMAVGQLSKFSPAEKAKIFQYYQRVMQKVLLRRGRGRTLLSKSHLIDFVQILSDNIPEAKFVDIVRHPKDSLVSWLALQQAGSRVFVRHEFPLKEAVQAHLQFWELFFSKEIEYFPRDRQDKTRVQLTFKEYCVGPDLVVKRLYKDWDLPMHADLQKSLDKWKREQDQYKSTHKYGNPTLEELGLTQEEVNERYKTYIQAVNVGQALVPPRSPEPGAEQPGMGRRSAPDLPLGKSPMP